MEIEQQIKKQGYAIVEMTRDQVQQYESLDTKYNAIVLCDRGSAVVEVNMRRVEMGERSCTFWHHVFYMGTVHVSEDFHAWVLVVSDTFSNTVSVGIPLELIQSLVTQGPRRKLTDDEWQLFESFMRSIRLYDRMGMSQHSYEVAGGVLRSMIIALAEMNTAHGEEIKANYNMADNYFRRFVTLVAEHVKSEHEVLFYAQHLNITPKYLSEICKAKSGHKAKNVISAMLIAHLKRDLILSGKSIKELASEYNFSDQSSLGKFFKKTTGISPSAFKHSRDTVER